MSRFRRCRYLLILPQQLKNIAFQNPYRAQEYRRVLALAESSSFWVYYLVKVPKISSRMGQRRPRFCTSEGKFLLNNMITLYNVIVHYVGGLRPGELPSFTLYWLLQLI